MLVAVLSSSCLTIGSSLDSDDDNDDEEVEVETVETCRPVALSGDGTEVGCVVVVDILKLISPGYERSSAALRWVWT